MFPEPVHYSRTDSPGWKIRDWDSANSLLGYLEPTRRPFAIFELSDSSYVQCFGSKTRLTVEAREISPGGAFTHWVFGKGIPTGVTVDVESSTAVVTVDETQVLAMRDARLIIRQFIESRSFPLRYHRVDISSRFTAAPAT